MVAIRSHRPEDVAEAVGLIYETATGEQGWMPLLQKLQVMLHASRACITTMDFSDAYESVTTGEPIPREAYVDFEAGPYGPALARLTAGAIYRDHQLGGHNAIRASRFWHRWMKPREMYGGIAMRLDTALLDVQRGANQESFSEDDDALMRFLAPHVARAHALFNRMSVGDALHEGMSSQGVATILVDADLSVLAQNAAARDLVSSSRLIGIAGNFLHVVAAHDYAQLKRMTADACRRVDGVAHGVGGDLILGARNGLDEGMIAVSVMPAHMPSALQVTKRSRAVITLKPIQPRHAEDAERFFRSSFALTPAEARLCAALAAGKSVSQSAAEQGLRASTLRSYLDQVFRKTGTRRQAQLVALLKSAEAGRPGHG